MQSDAELLAAEPAAAGHGARAGSVRAAQPGWAAHAAAAGSWKGAAETERSTDITERASSGALLKELEGYFVGWGFLFVFCLFVFDKTSSQ